MRALAANAFIRFFLAPPCAACGHVLEQPLVSPVCAYCWRGVLPLSPPCCVRCGDMLSSTRTSGPHCTRCRRQPPVFTLARSAGRYEGSLREVIHAFKYEGRRVLARQLAELMKTAGEPVLAGADAVVPVPLHPWRVLQRGFNQADDLACGLGMPVWRVLARTRHGPPQAALPAGRRHANVRRAYAIRTLGRRQLRNRVVVLVDDVMTTGATLDACGRVLLSAGVRSVRALTAARAVARPLSPLPPRLHQDAVPR